MAGTAAGPCRRETVLAVVLWVIAVGGAGYLAYRRYKGLVAVTPFDLGHTGGDFWGFLHSAREVAAGRSPYAQAGYFKGFYVYSPLVALSLAPFVHASTLHLWEVWTALSLTALVIFGGLVTVGESSRLRSWRVPLLFGIAVVTILQFGQTWIELYYGNTDPLVLVLLAIAILALGAGWTTISGVLLGVTGLVKTWPAAAGLVAFRRGFKGRSRVLLGLVSTMIFGPVLAAALGGASGCLDFFRATFAAHNQYELDYSVWSTPFQLFTRSGLARPLIVSPLLRYVATAILALWVIGLLALILHWSDSSSLAFWNAMACVVLLLPVSHSDYTLFLLPILWIWVARWLERPGLEGLVVVVTACLVAWWVISRKDWYYGSNAESALRISVVFFANLAAVSVSVFGDHLQRLMSSAGLSTSGQSQPHSENPALELLGVAQ